MSATKLESSTAHANASAASALARSLVENGVRDVVLSPGSRSAPLVLAFAEQIRVRTHVVLDERAAGFVGLGISRASGRPVVLLCSSGSAGAHWLPAIIEAAGAHLPLIAITADRPPELQDCGAPQTIRQRGLFGHYTRWEADLGAPSPGHTAWLGRVAAQAVGTAIGPPGGPVHLNAPFREPLWQPDLPQPDPGPVPKISRAPTPLAEEDTERGAHWLSERPRGVVVCGPLLGTSAAPAALGPAVHDLATRLGWPVLADALSGVRQTLEPAQVLAAYEPIVRSPDWGRDLAPQAVLRLGSWPTSKALGTWLARWGLDATLAIDPAGEWLDPHHACHELLVADPVSACRQLAAAVRPSIDSGWLSSWREAGRQAGQALTEASRQGFWEGRIARTVVDELPAGGLLHVASSMPVRDVDAFALEGRDVRITANRGANGIDGTVATTWGCALGWPGPVVGLLGDLACLHDLGALLAAHELGVSATLVVLDNGGGGIFGTLPIAQHPLFERCFLTPRHLQIDALCRALGIRSRRVDDARQLSRALEGSMEEAGVDVVVATVDREDSQRRRDSALHALNGRLR